MKAGIIQQFLSEVEWGELDYLVIDLPPGTGDEVLTIAQSTPDVTGSVVVTTPQDVALLDSRKAVIFSQKLNIKVLGIVENMSGFTCPNCGEEIELFKKGGGEKSRSGTIRALSREDTSRSGGYPGRRRGQAFRFGPAGFGCGEVV